MGIYRMWNMVSKTVVTLFGDRWLLYLWCWSFHILCKFKSLCSTLETNMKLKINYISIKYWVVHLKPDFNKWQLPSPHTRHLGFSDLLVYILISFNINLMTIVILAIFSSNRWNSSLKNFTFFLWCYEQVFQIDCSFWC